MSKKKDQDRILYAGLVITCLLTMYAFLLWANNLFIAVRWRPGTDKNTLHGFGKWLDWAAVDYSTATTLIPLAGLIGIVLALIRIIRAHEGNAPPEFPFHKKFNEWIILQGFAGTVWGLILSLRGDKEFTSEKIMKLVTDLFLGMDTALWSTLIALLWVGFINYPLSMLFKWLYNRSTEPFGDQGPIIERFQKLSDGAKNAGATLYTIASQSELTEKAMKKLTDQTSILTGNIGQLGNTVDDMLKQHSQITAAGFTQILTKIDGTLEKVSAGMEVFKETSTMIENIKMSVEAQVKAFTALSEELKEARTVHAQQVKAMQELCETKIVHAEKNSIEANENAKKAEDHARQAKDDAAQIKRKFDNIKEAIK